MTLKLTLVKNQYCVHTGQDPSPVLVIIGCTSTPRPATTPPPQTPPAPPNALISGVTY